jgi:hypothetical protein
MSLQPDRRRRLRPLWRRLGEDACDRVVECGGEPYLPSALCLVVRELVAGAVELSLLQSSPEAGAAADPDAFTEGVPCASEL